MIYLKLYVLFQLNNATVTGTVSKTQKNIFLKRIILHTKCICFQSILGKYSLVIFFYLGTLTRNKAQYNPRHLFHVKLLSVPNQQLKINKYEKKPLKLLILSKF